MVRACTRFPLLRASIFTSGEFAVAWMLTMRSEPGRTNTLPLLFTMVTETSAGTEKENCLLVLEGCAKRQAGSVGERSAALPKRIDRANTLCGAALMAWSGNSPYRRSLLFAHRHRAAVRGQRHPEDARAETCARQRCRHSPRADSSHTPDEAPADCGPPHPAPDDHAPDRHSVRSPRTQWPRRLAAEAAKRVLHSVVGRA